MTILMKTYHIRLIINYKEGMICGESKLKIPISREMEEMTFLFWGSRGVKIEVIIFTKVYYDMTVI